MIPPGSDGTRELYEWDVTLHDEHGVTQRYRFRSYWDPEKIDSDLVPVSAAAQARIEQRVTLHATDAVLVTA